MDKYYYSKAKAETGDIYLESVGYPPEDTTIEVVLWESDMPFSGYPMVDGENLRAATLEEMKLMGKAPLGQYESIVDGQIVYNPPPPPTMHEQALLISLTKREFLKIIIALTATMPNPVTLAQIESYVAAAPDDIRLEWDYATYIERSHPALDGVANDFGITSEMLDIVFVNAQEFLRKIAAGEPLHEQSA